jgi:hypothetical protein
MLVLHHEVHGVTGFAASEAFINPLGGGNSERRSFFIVEWTQSKQVNTPFPEVYEVADYLFYPGSLDNGLNRVARDHKAKLVKRLIWGMG